MIAIVITYLYGVILACSARSIIKPTSAPVSTTEKFSEGKCPLVGAFIMPHGGITLNPYMDFTEQPGYTTGAEVGIKKLHEGMKAAAAALVKLHPDLIILSTPHGLYLEDNFVTLVGPSASGNAGWVWSNFTASFTMHSPSSVKFFQYMKKVNVPIELLSLGIGKDDMPLRWAEVVPWWFISEAAKAAKFTLPPVIYIGQPATTRLNLLGQFGSAIFQYLHQNRMTYQRVLILVSSDLSHHHSSLPSSPYPFDPSAPVFDNLITQWAKLNREDENGEKRASELLEKNAAEISDSAASCGYNGLLMLNGVLKNAVSKNCKFASKFYEYAAPTYFGMMASSWIRE